MGLLAGAAAPAMAQTDHSAPHAKPYYLDLKEQTILLPERDWYVAQVIDARPGQSAIGVINHGISNKQRAVLFEQGLVPELTAWLQQQAPRADPNHAVVLCVRQLRVGELVDGKSWGGTSSADLVADVYAAHPDGYHFVRNVADRISAPGVSLDFEHSVRLATLLGNCLRQLAVVDWAAADKRPARTLAQLATDRPQAARPAIARVGAPRRGVYFTVDDFLANQPDTLTRLQLDTLRANTLAAGSASEWRGTMVLKVHARSATGSRVPGREVWGFSDGRQAYVRQLNFYRPLTRQADCYTFVGAAPIDMMAMNQRNKKLLENSLAGLGHFGGNMNDQTGQPMVYSLDLRTGLVAPFLTPGQPLRKDTAFVYVYRPASAPDAAQRVFLNDHEVGQLRPGEYLELPWPHLGRPMRLSMGTLGGPATLAVPSTATANYVKLLNASATSPWQWMPARQGEADVDALERRGKQ
ncbi:hypothetical protein [Hymenobacter convexus]|uniref:hypothetical protein n=1 Tax=Hymenobacter sp. CA1UV-4 TaxID=3063782 RepID=UPI002713B07C|nr:hypothetical protein [Hymenobacter sp. CA1UV-4]MDO7854283.1 hypothetical protein [Hymenobacter sp. CA1UV-4]